MQCRPCWAQVLLQREQPNPRNLLTLPSLLKPHRLLPHLPLAQLPQLRLLPLQRHLSPTRATLHG